MPKDEDLSQASSEREQTSEEPAEEEAGDQGDSREQLQARLEEAERERSQFKAMAQRAQADLINYRQRVEKEKEEAHRSIVERTMQKLLPVLDDFGLALQHSPASAEEETWLEGIHLIERRLQGLLEAEGVTHIEAKGKPFDPWEHEALFSIETREQEAGTVADVIRPGYKLHDRVLRAAQVAVAQAPEQEASTGKEGVEDEPHIREEKEE